MAGELSPLPEGFIAAVDVRPQGGEDSAQPVRRLGMEITCHGQPRHEGAERLVVPVLIELFTSPPLLSTADKGVLEFESASRRVEIRSDGGHVRVVGELAVDDHAIRGHVDLKGIQVMDLAGSYYHCPIELAGSQEQ